MPSDSATRAAHDLVVTVSRLRRRLKEVAGLDDITPTQTSVLSRLDHDGPATTSDLARAERVRPQSMATTVAALEARKLVERRPDPDDGRRQLIVLSASIGTKIESSRQARREWLAASLDEAFTEDERATIQAALELLDRLT